MAIDKSVFENRQALGKNFKKIHGKSRCNWSNTPPIVKLDRRIGSTKVVPSNVRVNSQNYIMDEGFLINQEVKKIYVELTENYIALTDALLKL